MSSGSRTGGRDQRAPMERLVRLASALHHAGDRGVPAPNLIELAGWADTKDPTSALNRDFRHLSDLGWRIDNIAGSGFGAVYRMTTVDNRLRVKLSLEQQTALRRAAILANREDLADRLGLEGGARPADVAASVSPDAEGDRHDTDAALATVVDAVRRRRLLHFRYRGTDRVVHPAWARTQSTQWYLYGREDGTADGVEVKAFVVSRMDDVRADAPGSAAPPDTPRHTGLHPMSWEMDPPVEVTLRAPAGYVPDVRRWLGEPQSQRPTDHGKGDDHDEGDEVELIYRVTNRAALRARVYQLGARVSVVGPDEVRREILDELATMAGE